MYACKRNKYVSRFLTRRGRKPREPEVADPGKEQMLLYTFLYQLTGRRKGMGRYSDAMGRA